MIDVLIVRMVVAPAVMTLLGHSAWWLPAWLDGCCRVSISRAVGARDLEPAPFAGPRARAVRPPEPADAREG